MSGPRERLLREIRETVPDAPGVYAFSSADGLLLYIGKSVHLRQRMSSYFPADPLAVHPRLGRLTGSIAGFAWWRTRTELHALLLEDALIKQNLPPVNIRQKEFEKNRYLELTQGEYPACVVTGHEADFGTREVYGPFRDRYFANDLREVLCRTLGIRNCPDPAPNRRCAEFDLGRCAGPCRGRSSAVEYGELVESARGFLAGTGAGPVIRRLVAARDRAAQARRYEEAARLRDTLALCRRYEARQIFARRFEGGNCRVICDREGVDDRFRQGALEAPRIVVAGGRGAQLNGSDRAGFNPGSAGRRAVRALHESPLADRRFLADRARVVYQWVQRQGENCGVRFEED